MIFHGSVIFDLLVKTSLPQMLSVLWGLLKFQLKPLCVGFENLTLAPPSGSIKRYTASDGEMKAEHNVQTTPLSTRILSFF